MHLNAAIICVEQIFYKFIKSMCLSVFYYLKKKNIKKNEKKIITNGVNNNNNNNNGKTAQFYDKNGKAAADTIRQRVFVGSNN